MDYTLLVAAIAAAATVVQGYVLVWEMRKTRASDARRNIPTLILELDSKINSRGEWVNLRLRNLGPGFARNVELSSGSQSVKIGTLWPVNDTDMDSAVIAKLTELQLNVACNSKVEAQWLDDLGSTVRVDILATNEAGPLVYSPMFLSSAPVVSLATRKVPWWRRIADCPRIGESHG
jgi:hypothetical protein